jgi:hypothetical protein
MFVMLGAYQCQVFLDWRFVSGEQWKAVFEALKGAGVESIQAKFDALFVVKEDVKPVTVERKKSKVSATRATKKPAVKSAVKKPAKSSKGKPASKKTAGEKVPKTGTRKR